MARGRKKSEDQGEVSQTSSRRSSRTAKKISYSESNEEDFEAIAPEEAIEPEYEEPKPKRGRGGKRKNSRTGTTATRGRKKKVAPVIEEETTEDAAGDIPVEETKSEEATEGSETNSTAEEPSAESIPPENGTDADNDDRIEEGKKEEEKETEAETIETEKMIEEEAEMVEPEAEKEAESENGNAEKEAEEFVMIEKNEMEKDTGKEKADRDQAESQIGQDNEGDNRDQTLEETHNGTLSKELGTEAEQSSEHGTEKRESEPTAKADELPDFEEENEEDQDPDALQLDANIDMDEELNKVKESETKAKVDEEKENRDKKSEDRKRRRRDDETREGKSSPPAKRKSDAGNATEKVRAPSPPAGDASEFVHVTNLVRPFTLNQLKEFLKVPGEFDEESFWIDKIKSNCIVKYNDIASAINCRKLIHGKKWPSSNPKKLRVIYSSQDNLDEAKSGKSQTITREKRRSASRSPKRRIGGMRSEADFERDRKTGRKPSAENKLRNASSTDESESEVEVSGPGNMLDELFKKTKTVPSLYWMPLTDAEIEARDLAREERKKAREQRRRESEERRKKETQKKSDSKAKSRSRSRSRRRSGSRNKSRSKSR